MSEPKYPDITITIPPCSTKSEILWLAKKALERAGVPELEICEYEYEATRWNYDWLVSTTERWLTIAE